MNDFAVIDIGSNSVRLMRVADGKVFYKTLQTTRLGEGLAASPYLKEEAIERTATAVADFYHRARTEGVEAVYAFATAAVRTAENRQVFLDRVKDKCGLTVEVVSGEEEAELGVLGAIGNADGGIVDIGGASTEIVVQKGGVAVYKKSVDIGVVRLKDMCGRDPKKMFRCAIEVAEKFGEVPNGVPMYAIGGTATTLGALKKGLTEYDSALVTGTLLDKKGLKAAADSLLSLPVEEIAKMPCVEEKRADVIGGGATLLFVLADKLAFSRLIVSDRDNLEGYAIKRGLL